jgi:hypothetical protein
MSGKDQAGARGPGRFPSPSRLFYEASPPPVGNKKLSTAFPQQEAVTRRSPRRLSRIAKGRKTRCSKRAHARIAKGDGLVGRFQRHAIVSTETPPPIPQPGMCAIDSATDESRTITELSAGLQAALVRLSQATAIAHQGEKPLATISAIAREAPLASLFVAFLFGVAVARRR